MRSMAKQRERRRNIRKLRNNYCISKGVWFIVLWANKHGAGRLLSLFPSYARSGRLDHCRLWVDYMYRCENRRSQIAYVSTNIKHSS